MTRATDGAVRYPAAKPDAFPRAEVLRSVATVAALLAILAAGAYLRFTGLNWDQFTHLHPDERFITMVENALGWPKDLSEYFDTARSPLNPYNRGYNSFVYGTFPLFLVKWLGIQLNMNGYDEIHLVGRAVSSLFDLGTVVLTFLIGARIFGRRAGLVGALLSAAAVTQIQQSHFFTFDTFVGFFLLASLYFTVRIWQEPRWWDYPLLGAALGLAMASKINSATFALVVAFTVLKQLREVAADRPNARIGSWAVVVGRFSIAALVGLLVFRVAQPYAFAGPGFLNMGLSTKFLGDMGFVQKLMTGEVDQPPGVQWANTPAYLFPLRNLLLWGMGLPLGIVGWAGLLYGGYRLLRCKDTRYALVVIWVAFFFLYQGGQFAKTMRYFLPVVPLLALLGSQMLIEGFDRARARIRSGKGGAWPRLGVVVFPTLLAVVAVGTLLYAYAFTRIYTKPVTRIEASEWIFANVPRSATIANEHWDDPLPLRWRGRDAGWYRGTMLELYNEDNPEKLQKLAEQLDATDYIFLSSNRLYGSIPRMPMRYPLTTEYYRLLFNGELGFELVKTFTSYPTVFGIEINDDGAEEIFSVYDHPKVLIFKKAETYSPARTRQLLGAVSLDGVLNIRSNQAQYNGLLLSGPDRQAQQSGGTWSTLYDRDSLANRLPTLVWWLVLELVGLLALPLTWRALGRLPDGGYGVSKVLGLVVVTYTAWLLPSLRVAEFGAQVVLAGMAVLGAVGAAILVRGWREFVDFLRRNHLTILAHELVFLCAFSLFWVIRANNPDLWHLGFGGEKPMEFAYLNAVAKSTYFPPYDPWFAGGYINYYYFGYVIVASLMRLTGIVPAVAFNLAIPTVYAATAGGLFSVGLNFAASRGVERRALTGLSALAGTACVFLVLVVGNLDGAIQRLESLWTLGGSTFRSTIPFLDGLVKAEAGLIAIVRGGKVLPPLDFWRSTRLIPGESPTPIMEFPWFTFLYGDLHPHMLSMPIAVLVLSLALAIVWQGGRWRSFGGPVRHAGLRKAESATREDAEEVLPITGGEAEALPPTRKPERAGWTVGERGLTVLIAGLAVGTLQATNSWDFPTYLVLLSAAYLLAAFARDRALTVDGALGALFSAGLTYAVAQLLFLPYTRSYELFYNGVDPSPAKTDVRYFLVMFGLFLFCMGSGLLSTVWADPWHRFRVRELLERFTGSGRWDRRQHLYAILVRPSPWMEIMPWAAVATAIVIGLALLSRQYLVALLVALCLLALLALFSRRASPEEMLLALFVGLGAALTLAVEFVTIKGDIGRMNTVFKFYLQAWFLFGIASALLVLVMLLRWRSGGVSWDRGWRPWWIGLGVVLFAATMVYPIGATPTKVGMRFQATPPTLDGMAYMRQASFKDQNADIVLSRDYEAIRWIQDNVTGSPVVLEAQIPEYRWGSRVSIYTGLPTVLGWTWHQRQQRSGYGWMVDQRLKDVRTAFETTDAQTASALLTKYDVGLVYVGDIERAYYSAAGLAKFDRMAASGQLGVVYRANGITIYEVRREGRPSLVISDPAAPGQG